MGQACSYSLTLGESTFSTFVACVSLARQGLGTIPCPLPLDIPRDVLAASCGHSLAVANLSQFEAPLPISLGAARFLFDLGGSNQVLAVPNRTPSRVEIFLTKATGVTLDSNNFGVT